MKQDPDPINATAIGKPVFAISGSPVGFDAAMIPKLFVAYVAAQRAEYYAAHDAAECEPSKSRECFEQVFHEEIRHALRDRSEITDWMGNNMDVHLEPCDEIGVAWIRPEPETQP